MKIRFGGIFLFVGHYLRALPTPAGSYDIM